MCYLAYLRTTSERRADEPGPIRLRIVLRLLTRCGRANRVG